MSIPTRRRLRLSDVQLRHPEWSAAASIYQLNTRQFTVERTFRAAEAGSGSNVVHRPLTAGDHSTLSAHTQGRADTRPREFVTTRGCSPAPAHTLR